MKKLFLFFVFAGLVCFCFWIGFGGIFALNFTFAILSFALIVSIVFYVQKRKIQGLIQNASQEELEALSEAYKSKQERAQEEEEEFWGESRLQEDSKAPTQSPQVESQEDFKPTKTRFWQNFSAQNAKTGAKMFFYPLRLFVYGFFLGQTDFLCDTLGFLLLKIIFAPCNKKNTRSAKIKMFAQEIHQIPLIAKM
ncbi:hypothetical protein [Helicobacter sp. UBA3407]|uniref:hypothetical protein n=2 Tax=Helicobacter TaxID=209 RepID=UPI00262ECE3B|nr:hypothetical protein [Helicobacter sp. UBA3407]